jgi:hypothetical protein
LKTCDPVAAPFFNNGMGVRLSYSEMKYSLQGAGESGDTEVDEWVIGEVCTKRGARKGGTARRSSLWLLLIVKALFIACEGVDG